MFDTVWINPDIRHPEIDTLEEATPTQWRQWLTPTSIETTPIITRKNGAQNDLKTELQTRINSEGQ